MNKTCRFVVTLLLATAAALPATAQPPSPTAEFKATFVQSRTLPGFETPLVSHGSLQVDPKQGFRWEVTAPYHYVFSMTDGRVTETLPDGTTRNLDAENEPWLTAVEHIFVSALSGDQSDLERYFSVRIEVLPEHKGRHVELIPKSDSLASIIEHINVIEAAPGQPQRLQIKERSGGTMDIRFTPVTSGP